MPPARDTKCCSSYCTALPSERQTHRDSHNVTSETRFKNSAISKGGDHYCWASSPYSDKCMLSVHSTERMYQHSGEHLSHCLSIHGAPSPASVPCAQVSVEDEEREDHSGQTDAAALHGRLVPEGHTVGEKEREGERERGGAGRKRERE